MEREGRIRQGPRGRQQGHTPDLEHTAAFNTRGLAWYGKKELDKAFADFTKTVELDPKNYLAYGNRGRVWADRNEHAKVITDYDKAIALNPKAVNPVGYRAVSLAKLKKYDDAVKGFEDGLNLVPPDWLQARLRTIPGELPGREVPRRQDGGRADRASSRTGREERKLGVPRLAGPRRTRRPATSRRPSPNRRRRWRTRSIDKDERKKME